MLNNITLIGRISKTPELRKTNTGVSAAEFSFAFDNPDKNAEGQRDTTFIDVKAFRELAENVVKHTDKGSKIGLSGQLTSRSYIAKDGSKRVVIYILASSVEFLDSKPANNASPSPEEVGLNPDEAVEVAEVVNENPEPKFDAFTGKPLKAKIKK